MADSTKKNNTNDKMIDDFVNLIFNFTKDIDLNDLSKIKFDGTPKDLKSNIINNTLQSSFKGNKIKICYAGSNKQNTHISYDVVKDELCVGIIIEKEIKTFYFTSLRNFDMNKVEVSIVDGIINLTLTEKEIRNNIITIL